VTEHTAAITTGFGIAARRLLRVLRIERSLGYIVNADYQPLDASSAHVALHVTCQPDRVAEVEGLVLNVLDDLVRHGPTQDELDRRLEDMRRMMTDPASTPGRLDAVVRDLLIGREPDLLADVEAEQAALTPADVRHSLEQAMHTMLMVLPETGFVPNRSMHRYPGPLPDLFPSQAFPEPFTKRWPWDATPPTNTLRIGPEGIAIDDPDGRRLTTILWVDCVAVVHASTGRRVMGRDGYTIDVEATAWQRGEHAVRLLDEYAPPGCVVRVRT
jgi:zinc protease